jgi:hypothetical protein
MMAKGPEQGDPRLLDSDVARRLLASSIPARYAYTSADGTPRVVASWFHWTGEELVMPTFVSAPHVRHPAYRVRTLRANPEVAVTIDTESFPPEVLTIRGNGRSLRGRRDRARVRPRGAPLSRGRGGDRLPRPDRSPEHQDGAHRRPPDLGGGCRLPDTDAERAGRGGRVIGPHRYRRWAKSARRSSIVSASPALLSGR